jgi:hypothetical protein
VLKYLSAIVGRALSVGIECRIARLVTGDNAVNAGERPSSDNAGAALSSGSKVFEYATRSLATSVMSV